jgi:hypothetical protein
MEDGALEDGVEHLPGEDGFVHGLGKQGIPA